MKSETTIVATQYRLQQWTTQIQEVVPVNTSLLHEDTSKKNKSEKKKVGI